jgi:hypothetical protein
MTEMTDQEVRRRSRFEQHSQLDCRACWDVLEMCIRDTDATRGYVETGQHAPPAEPIKRLGHAVAALIHAHNERRSQT